MLNRTLIIYCNYCSYRFFLNKALLKILKTQRATPHMTFCTPMSSWSHLKELWLKSLALFWKSSLTLFFIFFFFKRLATIKLAKSNKSFNARSAENLEIYLLKMWLVASSFAEESVIVCPTSTSLHESILESLFFHTRVILIEYLEVFSLDTISRLLFSIKVCWLNSPLRYQFFCFCFEPNKIHHIVSSWELLLF